MKSPSPTLRNYSPDKALRESDQANRPVVASNTFDYSPFELAKELEA
jgi:hypothetical protein